MHYSKEQNSAVQMRVLKYNTEQYSTVYYNPVQRIKVQSSVGECRTVQYGKVQTSAVKNNALQLEQGIAI